jgi:nitroreductase
MNETIDNIVNRRSIRGYQDRPVKDGKIELILKYGQFAPSAQNHQSWHFAAFTKRSLLDKISDENKKILQTSNLPLMRERAQRFDFDSFHGAPMAKLFRVRSVLNLFKLIVPMRLKIWPSLCILWVWAVVTWLRLGSR